MNTKAPLLKLGAILALGFASGLPLALTASTLAVLLVENGIDKTTIGLFAAVATPYSLKFLWAPLVDTLPFPLLTRILGRRRGWLIGTQILLALAIIALGAYDVSVNPFVTAWLAFLVAALSATQDIVVDAYRVEMLPPEQQGNGAAVSMFGYRIGMLVSSAGALLLAEHSGWAFTYTVMAALLGIGAAATLLAGEPKNTHRSTPSTRPSLREAVIMPFKDFMNREQWVTILLFIFLFKFGDAFIGIMTNPFLLELGFTKTEIAEVVKIYGLIATLAGGFFGGWLVQRYGMWWPLMIGGILQAVTNLPFAYLALEGHDMTLLAIAVAADNFYGGMASTAIVAYLSSLCNIRYTATQYALLSSLAALARTLFSTPAGAVAESIGWPAFFIASTFMAIPGLVLLWMLKKKGS